MLGGSGKLVTNRNMGRIKKLPDHVANRIAAGEVVERPASVVKELIENAIDAGATYIEIALTQGGKELVQITDDGSGMTREDVVLAIERHATSKISDVDDLESITTLGFRGEALPSIASVSLTEIVSRTADSELGYRVLIDHGEINEQGEFGARIGTTVSVRQLFGKIPARRRFLKSDRAEVARCNLWIIRISLIHPEISFRVETDERESFYTPAVGTYMERIEQIFGAEFAGQLLEIEYIAGDYHVFGYAGDRTLHRARASEQYFFLNGRSIKSILVSGALKRAYSGLIPPGRHAVAFLFIEAPPGLVDVNVHPAKMEVRFRREDAVFGTVFKAIANVIGSSASPAAKPHPQAILSPPLDSQPMNLDFPQPNRPMPGQKIRPNTIEEDLSSLTEQIVSNSHKKETGVEKVYETPKFIQILNTYIVVPTSDGMLLIDQHAAHERVLFERVMESLDSENSLGQRFLIPVEFVFPLHLMPVLAKFLDRFAALGFEIEIASQDRVRILAVPSFVKDIALRELLQEIIEEISEGQNTPTVSKNFAASIACHSAIKGGQKLSEDDMRSLFEALFASDYPYHCPHGRPTMIKFDPLQLEKMFGRRT